jgi:hypothetical protein
MNTKIESYLWTAVAFHESFDDVSSPELELLSSLSSSGTEVRFHHHELRRLPRSSEEFSNTRPALQLAMWSSAQISLWATWLAARQITLVVVAYVFKGRCGRCQLIDELGKGCDWIRSK